MRRSPVVLTLALALVGACGGENQSPPSPLAESPAPLYAKGDKPSIGQLNKDIKELLGEPARGKVVAMLANVLKDAEKGKPTVVRDAWAVVDALTGEHKNKHINPEKVGKLLEVLCGVSQVVSLSPPGKPAVDLCKLDTDLAQNDAVMQVVFANEGGTVQTQTLRSGLRLNANSLPSGVEAVMVTAIPIKRLPPFQCYFATTLDCYPEFYEWNTVPNVAFSPAAVLATCQEDAGVTPQSPPTHAVLHRLRVFTVDAQGQMKMLAPAPTPATPIANCDSEPHHAAIGPVEFSRWGLANAARHSGRAASRLLGFFAPKPLYAENVPTHGLLLDEWFGVIQGNVVGSVDPLVRIVTLQLAPAASTIPTGGTAQLSATARDKASAVITRSFTTVWTSSNPAVATVSSTGLVTAVGTGSATITGKAEGVNATAAVTVVPPAYTGAETGDPAWAATSFWTASPLTGVTNTLHGTYVQSAGGPALPAPAVGARAWWFGQSASGSYIGTQVTGDTPGSGGFSTAVNLGDLASPEFTIPSTGDWAVAFRSWFEIESVDGHAFDQMIVYWEQTGGPTTELARMNPTTDPNGLANLPYTSGGYNVPPVWNNKELSLNALRGQTGKLHFYFTTGDIRYNGFRGWVVDDVIVRPATPVVIARVAPTRAQLAGQLPIALRTSGGFAPQLTFPARQP